MNEWKSPRKIQEEIEQCYRTKTHETFEGYMLCVDDGILTRPLAILAIRHTLSSPDALWCPFELLEQPPTV